MRIAICDDNSGDRSLVEELVREYFENSDCPEYTMGSYSSGEELLANETKVDMAFLDVEMSGDKGTHIGAKLMERNPRAIVFVITGYSDYLDETMRYRLFRFYMKPLEKQRFFRGLKDAVTQYLNESAQVEIDNKDGLAVVDATEIIMVKSVSRKTVFSTTSGEIVSERGINYWAEVLHYPYFYRSHRGYIVNFRYVRSIDRSCVVLRSGDLMMEAYLSGDKFSDIKRRYLIYRGEKL